MITSRALRFSVTILAAGLAACSGSAAPPRERVRAQSGSSKHIITLTFDYDFTKMHACTTKIVKKCVKEFQAFDISGDLPLFLFSIPVPDGATGPVKVIAGKSPLLLFEDGEHRLGVSAVSAEGVKSEPRLCKVLVIIKSPPAP